MTDRLLHVFAMCVCLVSFTLLVLLPGCSGPQVPLDPEDRDTPVDESPDGTEPEDPDPTTLENTLTVNFQTAAPGIAAALFDGSGFATEPLDGQLDSDSWSVLGFSDGDFAFGGEAASGDFARGISSGGVSTGGLYAFTIQEGDIALGVQPTSTDFAPGRIILRTESPGSLISCSVSYEAWTLNNADRSTAWSVSWSTDGETWIELESMAHATAAAADAEPSWSPLLLTGSLAFEENALQAGELLYLKWEAADAGGSGGRDECAIDDLTVTFSYYEQ